MFENYYFVLGIINNLFLISIFLIVRFSDSVKLKWVGRAYLLLALPSVYGIYLAHQLNKPVEYNIFLGIFIAFLVLEGFYDFILKISFRKNWKLLLPYLMLYWSMNYGFIVMSWQHRAVQGKVLLGLFILQLITNIISHTKKDIDTD